MRLIQRQPIEGEATELVEIRGGGLLIRRNSSAIGLLQIIDLLRKRGDHAGSAGAAPDCADAGTRRPGIGRRGECQNSVHVGRDLDLSRRGQLPRELADHGVVFRAPGLLEKNQCVALDNEQAAGGRAVEHDLDRGERHSRRARHEVTADAARSRIVVLQMARPAAAQPAPIERRGRSIAGAARGEDFEHAAARWRSFAHDSVTVLAYDREPVINDCVPRGQDGNRSGPVELARQVEVHIRHAT
jgi:hypothetical protein